jgi:hypothetical protein
MVGFSQKEIVRCCCGLSTVGSVLAGAVGVLSAVVHVASFCKVIENVLSAVVRVASFCKVENDKSPKGTRKGSKTRLL